MRADNDAHDKIDPEPQASAERQDAARARDVLEVDEEQRGGEAKRDDEIGEDAAGHKLRWALFHRHARSPLPPRVRLPARSRRQEEEEKEEERRQGGKEERSQGGKEARRKGGKEEEGRCLPLPRERL
eukprot:394809-Rhodomonas_salina.1